MSTREALAALVHHVLLPGARQVGVGLPVGEAAVEEVWAWPAHDQFYCVRKDTVQSQGKAGSQAGLFAVGRTSLLETSGQEDQGQWGKKCNDKHGLGGEILGFHIRIPVKPHLLRLDQPLEGREELRYPYGG